MQLEAALKWVNVMGQVNKGSKKKSRILIRKQKKDLFCRTELI